MNPLKKGTIVRDCFVTRDKNLFSDHVKSSSKKLWKVISADDVKTQCKTIRK